MSNSIKSGISIRLENLKTSWRERNDSEAVYELLNTTKFPWYVSKRLIAGLFLVIVGLIVLQTFYASKIPDTTDEPGRFGLPPPPPANYTECQAVTLYDRFDCHPELYASKETCESRGCCWILATNTTLQNAPACFYPPNYGGYKTVKTDGKIAYFEREFKSPYPNDVMKLQLEEIIMKEYQCINIRVTPSKPLPSRYETPFPFIKRSNTSDSSTESPIVVKKNDKNFGFQLSKSDGNNIMETSPLGGMIYSDQLIQLSVSFGRGNAIYGIGERDGSLKIDPLVGWQSYLLLNADQPPTSQRNLYGSHPFLLVVNKTASLIAPCMGLLVLNSNAMEIVVQPESAVTFRMLGGIVDMFAFYGSNPAEVIQQYTALIGRPHMPPLWALGFHLCRFGSRTLQETKAVYLRNKNAGIPIDVQWNDLDYMKDSNDFTYDNVTFSGLAEFVNDLHSQGVQWVPLIDAGVSASEPKGTYPPFDTGIDADIFVKNSSGGLFIGKVWNRHSTVWPDFTHPSALSYWKSLLETFHMKIPFDGVWLDMNEPSNFYNGQSNGCPYSNLDDPPYLPDVNGGLIYYKTFCMSAKHAWGEHYNVHNIYGAVEAWITNSALSLMSDKRPFIISRSSYVGLGHFAGHWSGDVFSTWEDLKKSVPELLSFGIFGIPLMGADICGFNGNTTAELCARWYQLGAFYPFSRSHNTDDAIAQDPTALGDVVLNAARNSLQTRYSLLSYLYTLFYQAYSTGTTVTRAMFIEFPDNVKTFDLDQQFLWGSSLLIIPVLDEGVNLVEAYLPPGLWYDFYDGTVNNITDDVGQILQFDASINKKTTLLLRGGRIITRQKPELTSKLTIRNPVEILIGLDEQNEATGDVYFDDGISNVVNGSFYTLNYKPVQDGYRLTVTQVARNYTDEPPVNKITIYGKADKPSRTILVNGKEATYQYNSDNKVLTIRDFQATFNALDAVLS